MDYRKVGKRPKDTLIIELRVKADHNGTFTILKMFQNNSITVIKKRSSLLLKYEERRSCLLHKESRVL